MADVNEALNKIVAPSFTKDEIKVKLDSLPPGLIQLESKIAGHDLAVFYDKEKKLVLKPIFDVRGVREETFYRTLFSSKREDESLAKLKSFVPTYMETKIINEVKFLGISDLTFGAVNPSLMDVKMGFRTYDRDATDEKIKHEKSKDHLSKTFGFKVLAIRKWNHDKAAYEEKDRDYCRDLKQKDEVNDLILFYLKQSDEAKTNELKSSIMNQLSIIYDWFDNHNVDLFEFIGSSIFFIYSFNDGKLDCRLKLIDFAHVYPLQGSNLNENTNKDINYLNGLKSLMDTITQLKLN